MRWNLTKQQREHYVERISGAYRLDPDLPVAAMAERFVGCSAKLVERVRAEVRKELGIIVPRQRRMAGGEV